MTMNPVTYSRLAVISCVSIAAGYGMTMAAWSTIGSVTPGDVLTASGWNAVVGNVDDLNGRF